jgi:hypothetical protein
MIARGEDLILQRQKGAARIDEIDARQELGGDLCARRCFPRSAESAPPL